MKPIQGCQGVEADFETVDASTAEYRGRVDCRRVSITRDAGPMIVDLLRQEITDALIWRP